VPGTPTDIDQLHHEVRSLINELDVISRLRIFSGSLSLISSGEVPDAHYYVLELDTKNFSLTPSGYKRNQLMDAVEKYERLEKKAMTSGFDVVLVSGETISGLKRAYPNYFADTHEFLRTVEGVL
jgi:hypothetical protein